MSNPRSGRLQSVSSFADCFVGLSASFLGEVAETTARLSSPLKNSARLTVVHPPEAPHPLPSVSELGGLPTQEHSLPPLKPHSDHPEPLPKPVHLPETHPPDESLPNDAWQLQTEYYKLGPHLERLTDRLRVVKYMSEPAQSKPAVIVEFFQRYGSLTRPEERLSLVQGAIQDLLKYRQITYELGQHWLKAFEAICQTQKDFESELRMNTLVSFGYRNFMTKLSTPTIAPNPDHVKLERLASNLEADRDQHYQHKIWAADHTGQGRQKTLERKNAIKKVDWSQETLFPYIGLGNSGEVKSFKRMIQESPVVKAYFEKARRRPTWSILLGRYFKRYEKRLIANNEVKFIARLGRTANKANGETDAQTKTASIILLWQLKSRGGIGVHGLFDDFRFTSKAQELATIQLNSLLEQKTVGSLWNNDLVLLQTLQTRQRFSKLNKAELYSFDFSPKPLLPPHLLPK
ncbi:uncharacterized protein PGTG_10001 [Puccinia graminis f. sp. tritici CRL 75-36-700-3]|uniref:Uncharacterized protein n=1 Tax=Puccinia graminis f. sp. tritici (strain CRL 75-36-700-3 / race SCCL) TaxID=418459 RepID=E3KF01_PUCGT|nr:uncharacterized protein PGTG_10001 [Puccinia graminis f. sp. tritici CRL 75-36-700-3]EFP83033.2 hypothetical protein PGTG_10001 [Puccinia graminis f. sp. tritici CRL 75-36-700-3]